MQCLQRPGDILLLPRGMGHATINPYGFGVGLGALYTDSSSDSALSVKNYPKTKTWLPEKMSEIPMKSFASREGNPRSWSGRSSLSTFKKTLELASKTADRRPQRKPRRLVRDVKPGPAPSAAQVYGLPALADHFVTGTGPAGLGRRAAVSVGTALAVLPAGGGHLVPHADSAQQCHKKIIAFVHINKAGGTAMLENLATCCASRLLKSNYRKYLAPGKRGVRGFFFHASAWRQRALVGSDNWSRMFTFALVRNPWERQVSMFHFLVGKQCTLETARQPQILT